MKKTNLRILSFILALVILTLSLPTFPMVADAAEEEAEALEVGEEILTYTEEVELRDTFTKHFRRSDGQYVAVVYAEPVHAGESGNMTDIDNRLTYRASSGRYESANVAYYLTEEQDEFINQTMPRAIACVYDSRPVVHIMSITSIIQSNTINFSDDDVIALMAINLVHEMAHCFGMGEAYTIAGHDTSTGTACAMEYYDILDAKRFYSDTLTTGNAFCDDCVNTLRSLVTPFIDGN